MRLITGVFRFNSFDVSEALLESKEFAADLVERVVMELKTIEIGSIFSREEVRSEENKLTEPIFELHTHGANLEVFRSLNTNLHRRDVFYCLIPHNSTGFHLRL